jgi:hypothetical protein
MPNVDKYCGGMDKGLDGILYYKDNKALLILICLLFSLVGGQHQVFVLGAPKEKPNEVT